MPGTFNITVGQRSLLAPHEFAKGQELPGPFPNVQWSSTSGAIELVVTEGKEWAYARVEGSADVTATDTPPSGLSFSDTVTFVVLAAPPPEADAITIEVGPPEPQP